jgi:hypothetical protein
MDARTLELEIDEYLGRRILTVEQSKIVGAFRGMLIEDEQAELAAIERNFRGISA